MYTRSIHELHQYNIQTQHLLLVYRISTELRDVHPSEAMMHFPLFQIHPISETFFGLSGKFSQFDLCRKNCWFFIRL